MKVKKERYKIYNGIRPVEKKKRLFEVSKSLDLFVY
jgi:hypothetical protein